MRGLYIALPVIGLLLGGGGALAATTGGTASTTAPAHTSTMHSARTSGATGSRFTTEAEANKACGSASNVVWGNTGTKVYHLQGDKYFGHTKRGAFMCKSTATAEGFHQSGQAAHKG